MAISPDWRSRDKASRSRRHRRMWRGGGIALAVLVVLGGVTWALAWSPLLQVRAVSVTGLSDVLAAQIQHLVPTGGNMVRTHTSDITATIASAAGDIRDLTVRKHFPHTIVVSGSARAPLGVWCRGESCQYWDETGMRWGDTVPSVGPLLLMVRDQRSDDTGVSDLIARLLETTHELQKVGITTRKITLPDVEPGGVQIGITAGYDLLMDLQGDLHDQIATLSVFLSDHAKDATFRPQYIDLRTPERVYYR